MGIQYLRNDEGGARHRPVETQQHNAYRQADQVVGIKIIEFGVRKGNCCRLSPSIDQQFNDKDIDQSFHVRYICSNRFSQHENIKRSSKENLIDPS